MLWGSCYLAIRFAIDTMPPLIMAGVRFLCGGTLFWIWARATNAPSPTAAQWRWAIFTGFLLLGLGGAGVHWSEQYVPSGIAALTVTAVPLFIVLIDWLRPGGTRPAWQVLAGLTLGFGGIYLLTGAKDSGVDPSGYLLGIGVLLFAAFSWSVGSVVTRYVDLPSSQAMSTAIKLWAGGIAALMWGTVSGEWEQVDIAGITTASVLSLCYLIIFGSLAFAAYNWLLKNSSLARVATYAYVNPAIAVLLGVGMVGEPFTPRIAVAMTVIIGAVIIIVNYGAAASGRRTIDKSITGHYATAAVRRKH